MTVVVPFLDVAAATAELSNEIRAAVERVVAGGQYVLGDEVAGFEEEWASYCGSAYCVAVGSGLDALRLTLIAAGIGPGDEVLVPANTFIATWLAVSQAGAVPVPIEADIETFQMDVKCAVGAIGPKTAAILPVHLYGHPADMNKVGLAAQEHGLLCVADAAQAHGAEVAGQPVGSLGDAVAWSFYPSKNLGALGDAGAVTTDHCDIARRVGQLRNYGSAVKYVHEDLGYNSRMDELQAAVLRAKLPYLDAWNARRTEVAAYYTGHLRMAGLDLPRTSTALRDAWHLYVVRSAERNALASHLAARGVQSQVHYPIPAHLQECYQSLGYGLGAFPVAERLAQEVLSLPIGPHLTSEHRDHVVAAANSFNPRRR